MPTNRESIHKHVAEGDYMALYSLCNELLGAPAVLYALEAVLANPAMAGTILDGMRAEHQRRHPHAAKRP